MQVLGRNCRFLQGDGTEKQAVSDLRHAVKNGEETTVRILNYKKNGQPFWNMLTVAPMADADGTTRFFIGVQVLALAVCLAALLPLSVAQQPHTLRFARSTKLPAMRMLK